MQTLERRSTLWNGPPPVLGPSRCSDSHAVSLQTLQSGATPCDRGWARHRCWPGLAREAETLKSMPSTAISWGSSLPRTGGLFSVKRRTFVVSMYQSSSPSASPPVAFEVASSLQPAVKLSPRRLQRLTKSLPGAPAFDNCKTFRFPLVPKLLTLATVNSKFCGSGGSAVRAGNRWALRKLAIGGIFCVNQCPVCGSSVRSTASTEPLKESTSRAM
mmetsp:Transcript_51941/g.148039  ORF Transcript_51941/g.148039 Transcript_51941/m.148039 type:complete len:216 (-) Transcript_51941:103-750(-)